MDLTFWCFSFLFLAQKAIHAGASEELPLLQEIFVPKNLNENQPVKLNCDLLRGKQPVRLDWHFKSKRLEEDGRIKIKADEDSASLMIRSLTIDDVGAYECVASNEFGEHKRQASVYFNAKPVWTKEPRNVTASLNQEVVLECDAKSHPPPQLSWAKLEGQRIVKEFSSGILRLDLNKQTSGLYQCTASNSMGTIERTINVAYRTSKGGMEGGC